MIQAQCNQIGHQESRVYTFCLRGDCKNSSACCAHCFELHSDCQNYLKSIGDITWQLNSRRDWFKDTFDYIKELIADVENIVSQQFLPTDFYSPDRMSLTGLDRLGNLLRHSKILDITALGKQSQKIFQDLNQFKDLIWNNNGQFNQLSDQVIVQSEGDNLAEYKQGLTLYYNDQYQEAIECFDEALKIDKQHVEALYMKGFSLKFVHKYQESVNCFDECIKIDSLHLMSYFQKGDILQLQEHHEDAIKCFSELIKIAPDYIAAYQLKGNSLRQLSRLKDEEQCYIEGLKRNRNNDILNECLCSVQEEMKKQNEISQLK